MNNEKFDFGYGPVAAHKHPNGGGWVADSATVAETAYVGERARVYGNAQVYGNARVYNSAQVCSNALVYGNALVCDSAQVYDNAVVYGNAQVCGNALVYGLCSRTPVVVSGYEYVVTIQDEIVSVGCKTITITDLEDTSKLFPEENCPELRKAGTIISWLARLHCSKNDIK